MWKNRIFYALFLSVCLAFSMLYTSGISQILLIVAVAYPFAAAGLTAIQAAMMSADFTEKRVTVLKNTAFEFGISVKNGSLLPCVPLELVCARFPIWTAGGLCESGFTFRCRPSQKQSWLWRADTSTEAATPPPWRA